MIPFLDMRAINAPMKKDILLAIQEVVDSEWYIHGQQVTDFEKDYSAYNGVSHSIGVANGLDALRLSLQALGIGPGDGVIVPAHTFIASALAVSAVGATPVLADVDAQTGLLQSEGCREIWDSSIKAIMPVHLYGHACDMDDLLDFAQEKNVPLIEDCSQAHGARFKGQMVGSFGRISGASFYPGKNLGAFGDAGVVTTDDPRLARKVRMLGNYGSEVKYEHEIKGGNSRLDEIQAAILKVKLQHLEGMSENRRKLSTRYSELLSSISALQLPKAVPHSQSVWHLYVIRTPLRDQLKDYLHDYGIQTQLHYPLPVHLQQAYADLGHQRGDFPHAESYCQNCLSLPLYPGMSESNQFEIIKGVKGFFQNLKK